MTVIAVFRRVTYPIDECNNYIYTTGIITVLLEPMRRCYLIFLKTLELNFQLSGQLHLRVKRTHTRGMLSAEQETKKTKKSLAAPHPPPQRAARSEKIKNKNKKSRGASTCLGAMYICASVCRVIVTPSSFSLKRVSYKSTEMKIQFSSSNSFSYTCNIYSCKLVI